MMYKQKFAMM